MSTIPNLIFRARTSQCWRCWLQAQKVNEKSLKRALHKSLYNSQLFEGLVFFSLLSKFLIVRFANSQSFPLFFLLPLALSSSSSSISPSDLAAAPRRRPRTKIQSRREAESGRGISSSVGRSCFDFRARTVFANEVRSGMKFLGRISSFCWHCSVVNRNDYSAPLCFTASALIGPVAYMCLKQGISERRYFSVVPERRSKFWNWKGTQFQILDLQNWTKG